MDWLTATWLAVASACLTLAAIHALVAVRRRASGHTAFALVAASVAAMAFLDLAMLATDDVDQYGRWLWWYQFPVWSGVVATVAFMRSRFRAGRIWLGAGAIALRTLALAINAGSATNINFLRIDTLEKVRLFGAEFTLVHGVPNPWMLVAQLSLLLLVVFVTDAALDLWRRGDRRRAVTIGGSLVFFVAIGTMLSIGSYWGLIRLPALPIVFFAPIIVAMAVELSLDLSRAAHLADELSAKQEQLRGSEQQLALAADAASAGLWSIDRITGKMWATPRALAMFGLKADGEHRFDDVLRSVHRDDRARMRDFVASGAPEKRGLATEYRHVDSLGEVRWYASSGSVRTARSPESTTLMGATVDITERKRGEEQVARQRSELEQLSRVASLNEMSGALAHELNQPLAIIMSNAEAAQLLLGRSPPDVAELRAIVDDIVAADQRAGEVISRLRSMLQRSVPVLAPLVVGELMQGVLKFMHADLQRRGIEVDVATDEPVHRVLADRVTIEQVLINVILNACDAMTLNAPGDRPLTIRVDADSRQAHVRIVDGGIGLPATPEKVFDAFYTTKRDGLGLGLAISRSIVAAHGGRLWAEANADRGATFHLSLPLETVAA